MKTLMLALGASLAVSACGGNRPVQIEASNLPTALAARPHREIGPTSGTSCQVKLLNLIGLGSGGRVHEAKAAALAAVEGDALVDASVDASTHSFLIVARSCVTVSGTAVRFEEKKG